MKTLYRICIVLMMLPVAILASEDPKFKGKYTKTKTLNKEYTVNANAGLRVHNTYGNVDVVTWSENRTVIEVVITVNGNDEDKVDSKLNEIKVEFTGNGSLVTAKTLINGKDKNSSWSWWGKSNKNNVKMEINYTIKLPVTNSVDINNDYGAISIDKLEGDARLDCDYGQLIIGDLMGNNNHLSFDYSQNCSIRSMRHGKIDADYSGFVLDKVGDLEISADYSQSEIKEAKSINYNNDYGRMKVGSTGSVMGRGDYMPFRAEELTGPLNINSDYGSITVERITSDAGDITIRSEYAGIKLGYDSDYHFDFVINLSYASLSGKDSLVIERESKDYTNKNYSGYHGKKNSGKTINIDSEYGGVNLDRN